MKATTTIGLLATTLLLACARPAPAPPSRTVRPISVFPPGNRTGMSLLISGASFLERYAARSDRVTVEDVLAAEARAQLVRRGFTVTAPEAVEAATAGRVPGSAEAARDLARAGTLGGGALYLEIFRWEPDSDTHPAFVIVGLDATLVDVATGERLWAAHRAPTPVATPGTVTLGMAYADAARKVAAELLASWGPERSPP